MMMPRDNAAPEVEDNQPADNTQPSIDEVLDADSLLDRVIKEQGWPHNDPGETK